MLTFNQEIPVKDKMDINQVIKVSLMKEIIKPTRPHRHAGYHEMILLSQGAGFHEIDGQELEVQAPVAFYLRPGQTHCWNFSVLPKGYVILFREELLLNQDIDVLFNLPAEIQLQADSVLFAIGALLHEEFKRELMNENEYGAYLHLLISKLAAVAKLIKPDFVKGTHVFQQFKRLVGTYFAQGKSLGFYAGELNITTSVLNQTCKKAVDKTPAGIIGERVLLEAKLLLSATGKSVNEIAADLGFVDSPHFIRFFKQNTNLTPGTYREMALSR